MSEIYFPGDHTADEWRAMARHNSDAAQESWERSDTDGFLSQWASNTMANVYNHMAKLAENGGIARLRWLFDADGNPVEDWRWIETKFGQTVLVPGEGYGNGKFFNPSKARSAERREATDRAKGYTFGWVETEVIVALVGDRIRVWPKDIRRKGAPLKVISTAAYEDHN